MTTPPTSRDGEKTPETRPAPDFSKFNVHDSFCNPITKTTTSGEGRRHLSRQQRETILASLSERDIEVIASIQRYRYLLTNQLQRLYFSDPSTPTAGLRAASRSLKKLRELGLIDHLARRIGRVRAGSGAMVWYLTHAGERLIYLHSKRLTPTKRFFEPSPYFLAHTLAVAEVAVQLTELCQDYRGMELSAPQQEPDCWRNYSEHGSILVLKPTSSRSPFPVSMGTGGSLRSTWTRNLRSKLLRSVKNITAITAAGWSRKSRRCFRLPSGSSPQLNAGIGLSPTSARLSRSSQNCSPLLRRMSLPIWFSTEAM